MSIYLYKKFMISEPLKEVPDYVFELLASNDEVDNYKGSLDDTFTSNFRIDGMEVDSIITFKDKYRLELRIKKVIPDVDIYITLKRGNVEYFLMIKDNIENEYVFCNEPLSFLDYVKPNRLSEDWKQVESYSDGKIYINYEAYELTIHYNPISDFPDGMSIG